MAQDGNGETSTATAQPFLKSKSGWKLRVKALSEGKRYIPPGGHLKFPTTSGNDTPLSTTSSSGRPPFPNSRTDRGKRRVRFADTNQFSGIGTNHTNTDHHNNNNNWTIAAAHRSNGPTTSTTTPPRPQLQAQSNHSISGKQQQNSRKIEDDDNNDEQNQRKLLDIAAAAACRAAATAELARIQAERAKLCHLRGEMQASISALEREKSAIARKAEEISHTCRKEKDEEIRRLRTERLALQRQGRLLTAAPAARAEKDKLAELEKVLQNELLSKEAKEARYKLTIERIKKQLDEAHARNAKLADQVAALQRHQLENLHNKPYHHQEQHQNHAGTVSNERDPITTTKQQLTVGQIQLQQRMKQQKSHSLHVTALTSNSNKKSGAQSYAEKTSFCYPTKKSTQSSAVTTSYNNQLQHNYNNKPPNSSSQLSKNTTQQRQQQSLPNNNDHWIQYANGDIKRYYTDTGITEYLYYAVQCWQISVPLSSPILLDDHRREEEDGFVTSTRGDDNCPCIEVFYFPGGQVQANYPDGSKEILMPGTTLHFKVTPNGQKTAASTGEMSALVRRPAPLINQD